MCEHAGFPGEEFSGLGLLGFGSRVWYRGAPFVSFLKRWEAIKPRLEEHQEPGGWSFVQGAVESQIWSFLGLCIRGIALRFPGLSSIKGYWCLFTACLGAVIVVVRLVHRNREIVRVCGRCRCTTRREYAWYSGVGITIALEIVM